MHKTPCVKVGRKSGDTGLVSKRLERTWLERQAEAAALEVASTALPSLMQSLVSVTAAATASALTRAACSHKDFNFSDLHRSHPLLSPNMFSSEHSRGSPPPVMPR